MAKQKGKLMQEAKPEKMPANGLHGFLRTRFGAVCVLLLVVVAGTWFGAYRSLSAQVREVESQYLQDSKVRYQLDARIDSAMNLITVTSSYPALTEQTQAMRDARNNLIVAVETRDAAAGAVYANLALDQAAGAMNRALGQAGLSGEDETLARSDLKRISDAGLVLTQTTYNENALTFNSKVMGDFPANLLKRVTGVADAAVF